jgi:hypothetical protein
VVVSAAQLMCEPRAARSPRCCEMLRNDHQPVHVGSACCVAPSTPMRPWNADEGSTRGYDPRATLRGRQWRTPELRV